MDTGFFASWGSALATVFGIAFVGGLVFSILRKS